MPSFVWAVKFIDIWEYRVVGAKSVSEKAIEQAIYPYLGEARTIDDVDKATQAIQRLYQDAGMPTTAISVPDQDIVGGVVQINVDESKVRRVTIVGSRYFSLSGIRNAFPSLSKGKVLNIVELQEDVARANRKHPDLKVVPALKAGPVPGTVDVDLNVADELPLHGGIELTNYNSSSTEALRLSADILYANLWQKSHQWQLQAQTTPEDTEQVQVLATSYLFPVNRRGGKVALYGVWSDSEIASVDDITVLGSGFIFGGRWVQPISQTNTSVHSVSLGFDYKDFEEELSRQSTGLGLRDTPVDYYVFSGLYTVFSARNKVTDSFSTGFSFGSRLLSDEFDFNDKRFQADTSFSSLNIEWERTYRLPKRWSFRHGAKAQVTESPLLSNEQFTAGGIGSVHGYFESQIQGDKGFLVNLELSRRLIFNKWDWLGNPSMHIYYDTAQVFINEPLDDQADNFSIQSIGAGLKATLFNSWKLKIDSGLALEDEGSVEKNDIHTRASARYEF